MGSRVMFRPSLTRLEDRSTPATPIALVVGVGAGAPPQVVAYDEFGREVLRFNAFDPSFNGGVRVARADVNGDGQTDVIAAAGPGGGPHVKVFDGATGALLREFFAYGGSFYGGVFVDAADLNGDGRAEIVTGAGAGGAPHVKVFDGLSGGQVASFFAYGA